MSGRPTLPATDDRPPRFAEDRAEQLDGRRLAIRSGDADEPALRQQAGSRARPHSTPACRGLAPAVTSDVLAGNARALDDELDAVQQCRHRRRCRACASATTTSTPRRASAAVADWPDLAMPTTSTREGSFTACAPRRRRPASGARSDPPPARRPPAASTSSAVKPSLPGVEQRRAARSADPVQDGIGRHGHCRDDNVRIDVARSPPPRTSRARSSASKSCIG